MKNNAKTVLWWGRFDPDYSRNRILRQAYTELGWAIADFRPALSGLGDIEAWFRKLPRVDLVHVPCFRQRDLAAATRFARRRGVPLLFDPLISAYDKQVFERAKFHAHSTKADRLLRWERELFTRADLVLADTPEHARFFADTLGVAHERLHVVYVGAEEALFFPEASPHVPHAPLEVLFYGSFIPLQGPEIIIEAARLYQGPPVRWVLLGNGPLRKKCEALAAGLENVVFEDWVPYQQLPERIRRSDILLGVFGTTQKTQRVIPNKVFQALACGKPLITTAAPAYPQALRDMKDPAILWVSAGKPEEVATAVRTLASTPQLFTAAGANARNVSLRFFSYGNIRSSLQKALDLASKPASP